MRPTQALFRSLRRLRLTTKMVNGGYYKGNRTGSMGRHTKHGGYIIDFRKVRTYVSPGIINNFKLTPFVTRKIKAPKNYRFTPRKYLEWWKKENGTD